jgi:hypothetical protein
VRIKSDAIAGQKPYEATGGEDDLGTHHDGLAKEPETGEDGANDSWAFFEDSSDLALEPQLRDEVPDDARTAEEYRADDERAVVAELRNEDKGGDEGRGGARDFVKDVNLRIHV